MTCGATSRHFPAPPGSGHGRSVGQVAVGQVVEQANGRVRSFGVFRAVLDHVIGWVSDAGDGLGNVVVADLLQAHCPAEQLAEDTSDQETGSLLWSGPIEPALDRDMIAPDRLSPTGLAGQAHPACKPFVRRPRLLHYPS